jgi:hypothetical protein
LEWYQTPITSVLTEAQYRALQGGSTMGDALSNIVNSPVGSFGLNVLGPYGQIINAANAASKGNWTGAALSSLNAIGGFGFTDIADVPIGTAKNIAGLLNSYDKKDLAGMFTSGSNLLGGVPGSFTTAAQLASAGLALSNNDAAGFMKALGDLTGSKDAKVAASAISLKNAFESGNPYQLQAALSSFNSSVGNTGTSTSGSTGSKSITTGDFADQEYVRLKGLGWTKDQITNYFNTLEGTTGALDELDTSGFSDAKLAAFFPHGVSELLVVKPPAFFLCCVKGIKLQARDFEIFCIHAQAVQGDI